MRSLHLITDGRLMHTIQLERGISRQQIQANKDAINRLAKEAIGPSGIIISDEDNMEIGYVTVNYEYEDETPEVIFDKYLMFGISIVLLLGYMIAH